jgi:hypothetical protein
VFCSRIADFALKQLLLWVVKLWLALSVQKATHEEITFDELVDTQCRTGYSKIM